MPKRPTDPGARWDDDWRARLAQRPVKHHGAATLDGLLTDFPYDWSRYPMLRQALEIGSGEFPKPGRAQVASELSTMLREARLHALEKARR